MAEDPIPNSTKADQARQVGDQAPDSVQPDADQQADPAKAFNPKTIPSDSSDVLTLQAQLVPDLAANNPEELNPDTTYAGYDRYVFPNLTFSPGLKADRGERSDPDAVASDLDVTVTRKLAPLLGLNLDRSGFWPVSEYAKADPETIAKKAGDTPVTLLPDIEKYRPTKLPSIGDERDYNDEANAPWKLDPFYVVAIAVLLIFPLLLASQKFWRV